MDGLVRLVVDVGRGFVKEQDAALSQQRPPEDQHLPHASTQVLAVLGNGSIQFAWHLLDGIVQAALPEGLPDLLICVLVKRVNVITNGAREQLQGCTQKKKLALVVNVFTSKMTVIPITEDLPLDFAG